jgi:hypothetical protein
MKDEGGGMKGRLQEIECFYSSLIPPPSSLLLYPVHPVKFFLRLLKMPRRGLANRGKSVIIKVTQSIEDGVSIEQAL